ncbi:hypothetical protein RyT2_09720 [Pseudolactococcus yaeyamensis]
MKIIDKIIVKKTIIKNKLFWKNRQKKILDKNFSIISNNCWGGSVYRHYNLPYLSPTIGLYLFPEDYLKFINNLHQYISDDLMIISPQESLHFNELKKKGQTDVPIGRIDDIEIVFLHYKSPEEALYKWNERKQRINFENLIFKFSEMNGATRLELEKFAMFPATKKVMFISDHTAQSLDSAVLYKKYEGAPEIVNDTVYYDKYVDLNDLINHNIQIEGGTN